MKKLTAILLVLALSLACLPAFAKSTYYEEMGLAIDFDAIASQSSNYPVLMNQGVMKHDPHVALMAMYYFDLPEDAVSAIYDIINETENEEEAEELNETLQSLVYEIAYIIVTNANTPAEAGIKDPLPEGMVMTEFGESGGYHYYYITLPVDDELAAYDTLGDLSEYGTTAEAEKEKTRTDIERVQSELFKQLQAAEFSVPVDREADAVGQVIRFETTDLDGNPVSSADLFKDNEITMLNLWGTWCQNCLNEMGELAEIHNRIQKKGCGIVGVEYEKQPMEEVADAARQVLAENGVTYPNVIIPEGDPILSQIGSYPTSIFVDSEGRILTYPIGGAAVEQYESTLDKLLAGEAIEAAPKTGATANDTGTYRVIVYDKAGNPIEGAAVQFCDDSTCSFEMTNADGVAEFKDREQKVWTIHLLVAPEGYAPDEREYKTLDTFSDVNIFLDKAA